MKKTKTIFNKESGQAVILVIFVIGMAAFLVGLSLTQTGFKESIMGRTEVGSAKAFYAANSGIEDAFHQVALNPDFALGSKTYDLTVGEGTAHISVSGDDKAKTIEATGKYNNFVRKIVAKVENTSSTPGFSYAVHGGAGGFELRNNTIISGKNNTDGNVYSNTSVLGAKNDYDPGTGECKSSASAVKGSVWAVKNISKLEKNDSGVCVAKDAYAENIEYCFVKGSQNSPNIPSANCPRMGSSLISPAPTPIPLPEMGVSSLKSYLNSRGTVFTGNCILDGSGGPADCSNGTKIIGDIIITGNLTKPSNVDFKVSGPIWVKGNVTFDSLGSIKLIPEITQISQLFVVDGMITSNSNITFGGNGNAYLLFYSSFKPPSLPPTDPTFCDQPAISLYSNTQSVLFYAQYGCIAVKANSKFYGAILGEKIRVENNSEIEYDPALQLAIFGLTKSGGWQIISFKEE